MFLSKRLLGGNGGPPVAESLAIVDPPGTAYTFSAVIPLGDGAPIKDVWAITQTSAYAPSYRPDTYTIGGVSYQYVANVVSGFGTDRWIAKFPSVAGNSGTYYINPASSGKAAFTKGIFAVNVPTTYVTVADQSSTSVVNGAVTTFSVSVPVLAGDIVLVMNAPQYDNTLAATDLIGGVDPKSVIKAYAASIGIYVATADNASHTITGTATGGSTLYSSHLTAVVLRPV